MNQYGQVTNSFGIAIYARDWTNNSYGLGNSSPTILWASLTTRSVFSAQVYIFQTGPVPPGTYTIPAQSVANLWNYDNGGVGVPTTGQKALVSIPAINLTVNAGTCAVTGSAVNTVINLPPVASGSLSGLGSTAFESHFTIPLTCNAALGKNLWVSVADALNSSSNADYLTNRSGGTYAAGIGVRLTRYSASGGSGATVTVGPEATTGSYQWNAGAMPASGTSSIPLNFSAAYIQTGASRPTPGLVNTMATITFNYK
jgi:major type 1 subunit fimbrin (pilin)